MDQLWDLKDRNKDLEAKIHSVNETHSYSTKEIKEKLAQISQELDKFVVTGKNYFTRICLIIFR